MSAGALQICRCRYPGLLPVLPALHMLMHELDVELDAFDSFKLQVGFFGWQHGKGLVVEFNYANLILGKQRHRHYSTSQKEPP